MSTTMLTEYCIVVPVVFLSQRILVRANALDEKQYIAIIEHCYLYYKRGEPYLCSAKAPVLDGSGSRR